MGASVQQDRTLCSSLDANTNDWLLADRKLNSPRSDGEVGGYFHAGDLRGAVDFDDQFGGGGGEFARLAEDAEIGDDLG